MQSDWGELEQKAVACFEVDGIGEGFDLNIVRDFLCDIRSACLLKTPELLKHLLDWFTEYCLARSAEKVATAKAIQCFLQEVKEFAPPEVASVLSEPPSLPLRRPLRLNRLAERYLQLLMERNGPAARELISKNLSEGKALSYIFHRVLRPVLIEIGRRWLHGELGVEDEHYGTAVTQAVLIEISSYARPSEQKRGRVLLAGSEKELHDLGLRMVADLLEMDGWETLYFGPYLPSEALYSAIRQTKPDLIAMSATVSAHLVEMRDAIRGIRGMGLDPPIPILVGGGLFLQDRSLLSIVQADAWAASASHAVRVARRLAKNRGIVARRDEIVSVPKHYEGVRTRARKVTATEELLRLTSELSALHRQLTKRNTVVEKLNEEKNRFFGMAAHDLRNEVQVIISAARLLSQARSALSDSQRKLLGLIDASALSMLGLVDDYLDISKIEAGKLDLRIQRVNLAELVARRVDVARLFADQKGVRLRISGPSSSLFSDVDPVRVHQALDNILLNAIKYSATGSEVEIHVTQEAGNSVILVLDEGPGIPPEKLSLLFQPFKQLAVNGEAKKSGTGLGLYITRRVVETLGGKIQMTNRAPHGCRVSISFPSSEPAKRAA